jgi:hypothetical protein
MQTDGKYKVKHNLWFPKFQTKSHCDVQKLNNKQKKWQYTDLL